MQLPTDYQNYIGKSRYARFLDSEGRRENWDETVDRYLDYFEGELDIHHAYRISQTLRSEVRDAILNLHVMPSMRALMTAGEAARRENMATYNCSYLPIDRPKAFAEALYILMCGTGVGFSAERQVIKQLPDVPEKLSKSEHLIVVQDSKLGWAEAFYELILSLYSGYIPKFDTSLVRPAGERLKVFGGRASGPEPLLDLFEFVTRAFSNAAGRKLSSLEVHEIVCKTGEIVVVGGVRRSALISLSNLSDQRMRDAKSGDWWSTKPHLALANNSVAYTEKPEVGAFMDEWSSLYRSKSGERGIFNRAGSVQKILKLGRRDHRFEFGCNPCVTGDTPILTRQGYFPIRETVGKSIEIWNGQRWSRVEPFSTGVNPLVRIELSDGTELTCTPYHKFVVQDGYKTPSRRVEARNLILGQKLAKFDMPIVEGGREYEVDAYSQGFYQGDGCANNTLSYVYEPKMVCSDRLEGEVGTLTKHKRATWKHGDMLPKDFIPMDASLRYRRDWFAGLMDADGTVVTDIGDALQLSSVDLEFLKQVRLLLTTMGVQAKINLMHEAGERMGYHSQPSYRLLINQADTYRLVHDVGVSFERLEVQNFPPQRDARRFVTVEKVVDLGRTEETFCFTEPLNNTGTFAGIVTGQCAEIILRPRGLCNLSEAVVRANDSTAELRDKVRLAAIIGTWQSTQTRFQFVDPEWSHNAQEERLLGVSLTGIYDNPMMRGDKGLGALSIELHQLKSTVIRENRVLADEIGINPSVATTTIKPSGTVSQLVNSPSGIHQGHSEFYIRRVTGDNKDPVTQFMVDSGIPWEPHASKPQQMTVFSFPVRLGRGTVTRDDVTAIQHLELVKTYNEHWSEHAVSCTISVKESEWPSVGGWVFDHFDALAGVSFLPHFAGDSTYKQMPYETIDEVDYQAMVDSMPKAIDWSRLAQYEGGEDSVTGTREFSCVGNTCEIVDAAKAL